MRRVGILWALLTLLIAIGVGIGAYQWGLHDGLAQQIQNLPANQVPAPYYGHLYYGGQWGFGVLPFFPFFFPFFGFLFFLLVIFLVLRPRRWYGGGGFGHGPGHHFEEMHRRAHAAHAAHEPPRQ